MNNWEKDLKIYRLEQAPPKYENYQEYFEKYFVLLICIIFARGFP